MPWKDLFLKDSAQSQPDIWTTHLLPASRARPFPEEYQVLSWKSTQGWLKPEPQVGQGQGVVSKAQAQEGLSWANLTPPTHPQATLSHPPAETTSL